MPSWRRSVPLLLAFLLLTAVWLVLTPARVPLYDGLPTPNTYLYLHPPPGQPDLGPPGAARAVVAIVGGKSAVTKIHTDDPTEPQAYLVLQYSALKVPATARRVTLTIDAVTPPVRAPKRRVIDGNVYRFAATLPDGSPVSLQPGHSAVVELLGTGASGTAVVARFSAGRWLVLSTSTLSGQGYFLARTTRLGEFTLILTPAKTDLLAAALPFIVAGVLIVLVVAVGILQIRMARRRDAAGA